MGAITDQSTSPRNSLGGGTGGFELWLRRGTEAKGGRLGLSQAPKDELGILGEVGRVFQGERQVSSGTGTGAQGRGQQTIRILVGPPM